MTLTTVFDVTKKALRGFSKHEMTTYAAALSYQVFFSLFPFLIFLISLLGFLGIPEFFSWLQQQVTNLVPAQAAQQVNTVIGQLQQPQGGLLSFGIVLALWTASAAVRAVMNAVNTAYEVKEGRPAWKLYPLSLFYTLGLALLLILSAALMILGPQIVTWLGARLGLGGVVVTLWNILRLPLLVLLLTLSVALIYYFTPDVEQRFRLITPGTVVAVVVWLLASFGFSLYVQNFANYNATYGSLGAIIILLFYFYLSAAILLFGAELNAVLEHRRKDGKPLGEKALPDA